jgi:hypothetical protein
MFHDKNEQGTKRHELRRTAIAIGLIAMLSSTGAFAAQFTTSPDWAVNWDNTITYNLGTRANSIDPLIANNPKSDEGDYKFSQAGDVVTDRLSVLSEFSVVYKDHIGFKLSGSAWKDFAYDSTDESNPGIIVPAHGPFPAVTYQSTRSYPDGQYSSYTYKYYEQGGQLLDAFVFDNTDINGMPVYLKAGQFTEYWGNSLFSPYQGISVAQGGLDLIKAFATPGTQTKELLLPRPQISITAQITPTVSLSGQYDFAWDANRIPTGGTFLGPYDPLATGPTSLYAAALPTALLHLPAGGFVALNVPQGQSNTPSDVNNNFGLKLNWTPSFLNGDMGFYFRRFDATQPWVLSDFSKAGLPTDYHLSYDQGTQLYGYSLDTTFGNVSAGFEASYQRNTALNSSPSALVPNEPNGAKGNVLNLIANAIVPLSRSPLWDTGTLVAEMSYSQLLSVSQNGQLYNGVGYAGCPTDDKWDGCSTKHYVGLTVSFNPQWLQVYPGVDLSMPISDTIGVYGNNALNGPQPAEQGTENYSIGLSALIHAKTTVSLAYNGYWGRVNSTAKTPSGLVYDATGNGLFALDDRQWFSLTVQTSF